MFYGIIVELKSDAEHLVENIRRDFSFFLSDASKADIIIEGIACPPDLKTIPQKIPFFRTKDLICYESAGVKVINYLNKALSIYNLKNENCRVISSDSDLLHEITYLTILSRVGEKLDLRSIHRVHALGFTYKDNGILCLSSMGGGKTVLGLGLLGIPHVKLISDDTPLIDSKHQLLPFPIRVGVRPGDASEIPVKFCREIKRRKFGKKVLVDIEYFQPKIVEGGVPLKFIFIVKKKNNCATPQIKKANFPLSIFSLFRDLVLARGIAQIKEYFIQKDITNLPSKLRLLISRIFVTLTILRDFNPHILYLSSDPGKNVKFVSEFLEKKLK